MKILLPLLLLSLIAAFLPGCAQPQSLISQNQNRPLTTTPQPKRMTHWTQEGLKNQVRQAYTRCVGLTEQDGNIVEQPLYAYLVSFDPQGNRTGRETYKADGSLQEKESYTYDDRGYLIATTVHDAHGTILRQEKHVNDAWGNRIEWITLNPAGEVLRRMKDTYDTHGRRITSTQKLDSGVTLTTRNIYDDWGNMIGEVSENDGEVVWKRKWECNENGDWIHMAGYVIGTGPRVCGVPGSPVINTDPPDVEEETHEDLQTTIDYVYDKKGNQIESSSFDAVYESRSKTLFQYDEKGNSVLWEGYRSDEETEELPSTPSSRTTRQITYWNEKWFRIYPDKSPPPLCVTSAPPRLCF